MEKVSKSNSRRMYSWWWDSHISPKNSKWLQENLTDMDSKVKVMIKLLEQDADSFARRAEAYYKQRPELMKMVEEFYRAYRALAERYDHATGVIRQAQRTMIEAQIPMMFSDDSPSGSEPRTPNGEFSDEYDHSAKKKGWKQLSDSFGLVERVRKGLNYDEAEELEESAKSNENNLVEVRNFSKTDEVCESEDIRKLKEAIAELEAEKEASLAQYQESLDKLSQLEAEISQSKEDFRVFSNNASKAENEVVLLREALTKVETEKETKIQEYQNSLEKISDLQNILSNAEEDASKLDERATSAESEVQSLKGEMSKLALEKDESLNQYMKSLEMISNIENNLRLAEEDARGLKERAENAENKVELLKQTISKLTQEKTELSLQHQQCLEMISVLENKLRISEEEAKRLNSEVNTGVSKLKGAEEQCLLLERSNRSLHSELEALMLKMGTQTQELTEKQKEMGRLWACVQEERLRFVEAETAFQTLQHLHAQTQDELRSMASELSKRAQLLNVVETHNGSLQDEVLKAKEENEISALSIKNMQNEISGLKESKGTLVEEVALRIDQRNALQQEIYCLKEELNNLNSKHISILEQVHSVGMDSDSLGSSVKKLQDENSMFRETCHKESSEKAVLLGKMVILEQLIEKNSVLENSLSDLNAELEAVRGKIQTLEYSCQSLFQEKSALLNEKDSLMIQLEETIKNLANLSENNTVLENSLADAHHQLEALKAKSNTLEDSCHLLVNEKTSLLNEKIGLISELENTRSRLEGLGKIHGELEGRCLILEKEKESTLKKVEELQMSLEAERQNVAGYVQVTEKRELEMSALHEERQLRMRELDQVIDSSIENEIEIFVLRRTAKQLAKSNSSFFIENQKLLEEFNSSKKKITQLETNNFEKEFEIKSLSKQACGLRAGTSELLKVLNIFEEHASKDAIKQDNVHFNQLLFTVKNMKESICNAEEENQQRDLELSVVFTFIRQLQSEVLTVIGMNKTLESKLRDESGNNEALLAQNEHLSRKLIDTEDTCGVLQREKFEISEEKRSLIDNFLLLKEKNTILEKENFSLYDEVLALDNLSLFFRIYADEKLVELRELTERFDKLQGLNGALMAKLSLTEGNLEDSKSENFLLQEGLQKSQDELKELGKNLENLQDLNVALTGKLSLLEGKFEDSKTENFHLEERLQKSKDELKDLGDNFEKLQGLNVAVVGKLSLTEGNYEDSKTENLILQERLEKSQKELTELANNFEKLQDLNVGLVGKLSFAEGNLEDSKTETFQSVEKSQKLRVELKELGDNLEKLQNLNVSLLGKLSLAERSLEDSKSENIVLVERLQKSQHELKELGGNLEKLQDLNVAFAVKLSLTEGNLEDSSTENFHLQERIQKSHDELKELGDDLEKLQDLNVAVAGKLSLTEGNLEDSRTENFLLQERLLKSQNELKELGDNLLKLQDLKVALAGKLSLTEGNLEDSKNENFQLQERSQKSQDELKELLDLNCVLMGKISLLEGNFEDSKTENFHLQARLQKSQGELKDVSTIRDQLSNEIKDEKQILHQMELELNGLRDKSEIQEKNLQVELQNKMAEVVELESLSSSVFGQLQFSMISQLIYEQKFHELHNASLGYLKESGDLNTQLAAYGPEVLALKECISSLEDHTDIHVKFQNPEFKEIQDAQFINDSHGSILNGNNRTPTPSTFSDLCNIRERLQAIQKAAVEIKESMVQENVDLRSKLDASTKQLEHLQSETAQHTQNLRPQSEITESDNAPKDIMLDQVSDGSSYGYSKRESTTIELWDTQSNLLPSTAQQSDFKRVISIKRQRSDSLSAKNLSYDKLEISKRFTEPIPEGNKKKVLQRLDSDVQKLANLQITVQDLKRKLVVTEKDKRGKAVIECESLKGQLEKADLEIMKLFDLNGKLTNSIDDSKYFPEGKSSFDLEGEGGDKRRRLSEQARRMSEKIGRLQLEVQKLQFVLLKLGYSNKDGKSKSSETKRRVLLRDYLYGGGKKGQRRKKARFWGCVQPSTVED